MKREDKPTKSISFKRCLAKANMESDVKLLLLNMGNLPSLDFSFDEASSEPINLTWLLKDNSMSDFGFQSANSEGPIADFAYKEAISP
jgi:hypothetical protein